MISYVDKIVEHAPQPRDDEGEFPASCRRRSGIETNGNPWNISASTAATGPRA
jgi:hypothetical protein